MCYSGKCKYEDHMGNCTLSSGSPCKKNDMVSFLKENGFPATIHIETDDFEDKFKPFKGYHSVIKDEDGNILSNSVTPTCVPESLGEWIFHQLRKGINWELPLSIN